jgi:non-ribosomal peptide synthase protein (TIGR01720 family)
VLLTGLGHALAEWSGSRRVQVELEGHGREEVFEDVDLSRTVGWFTTKAPVLLEVSGDVVSSLKRVRGQLRGVGRRLLEHGLLRYLGPQAGRRQLAELPGAEVSFNYLGQWDGLVHGGGLLEPADRSVGMGQWPLEPRSHLVDVTSMVVGGRLRVEWGYSADMHRRDTVARWAERMLEVLRELL